MLSGILIKCMDFFSLLFWYILICVSNVFYPKMAYHIKFYKIETLKVKKKDISFKIRRYKWLYVVNQFEINESMHSKKIFVHIFNYTCILLLCSCTGKKELSYLEDFETDGSCCFLKRTKYLLLFYPQSILFLILIVTNIL